MKEEDAALKIQAGVRGYHDRQVVLERRDPEEFKRRKDDIAARLASRDGASDEEVDIDLDDPEVEKAAVKIQASFKGFKARKEVKETQSKKEEEEEEIDIDLEDPEVNKAAVKIQAGFRGHKSRLEYKSLQKAKITEDELADIDLNDPDLDKAAMKIQASFRGLKTRRQRGLETGEDSRKNEGVASQKDTKLIRSIFQKKQPNSASKSSSWYTNSSNNDHPVDGQSHATEKRKWWSLIRKPSNILSVLSYSTTTHHSTDSSWDSSSSEYGSDADTVVKPKIQRAVGFFRDMLENLRRTTDSESDSEEEDPEEETEDQHVEEYCENVINEQVETLSHNTSSSYTDSSSSISGFKRQFTVPTYTHSTLPSSKHWIERPTQSMDEFYEHISTTNEAIRKDLKEPLKRTLSSEKEIKKNVLSALWDNMQHSKAHPPFPVRPKKKLTPGGRFKMAAKKVIHVYGFRDQRICYRTGVHHCTADVHAPPRVEVTPWYMLNRLGYIDTSVNANVVTWLSESEHYQSESESSLDYSDPVFVKYVLLLQSVVRSRLAKKYWRLKPENSYSLVKACLLIQSVFRSRMARRKYEKFKKFHNDHINLKNPNLRRACIIVQSVFRYRLRQKSLGLYVLSKPRVELDENDLNYDLIKACLLIQAQFRTNLALKMCLSKPGSFENSDTVSKYSIRDAAILIQSAFRSKLAVKQLYSYLDWIERSSNSDVSTNQLSDLKSKSKHISWDPLIPNDSGIEKISLTKQYFLRKKQRESRSAIEQDPKLLRACLLIQSMFRSKLVLIDSPLCHQESFYNNLKHYLTNQNTQRAVETIQQNIRQVLNKKTHAIYTATPAPHVQKATSFLQSAFREKLGQKDTHTRTLLSDPKVVSAALLVQSAFRSYLFRKGSDPPTPTNLGKTQNFDEKTLKKSLAMLQISPTKRNIDAEDDDDEEDTLSCDSSDSPCAANEIDLEWSNTDIPPRPLLQRQHTDAGEALHRSYQSHDMKDLRKQYSVDSYLDSQHQSYFDPLNKKPKAFEYFEPKMPRSKISLQKLKSSSIAGSISEEQYYFDPKLRKATQLLQNAFRSHTARKKMKEQWFSQKYSTHHKRADDSRTNVRFRRAVLLIQSAFRTKLDKRWMTKMENLHNGDFSSSFQSYCTQNTAAKVIQSAFMKHLTKKLLTQTIEHRIKAKQSSSTNTALIRAIVRRHSSSSLPHQMSDQDSGTLRAILMMQAVFRYKLIQKEKAALLLQCVFKKTFQKEPLEVTPLKPRRYKDHVILLQTVFRRKLFMKVVEDARVRAGVSLSSDSIIKHIIILQSLCRIYFARKKKFEESVLKVQSCIRRKLLLDIVNELQHSSDNNSAEQSVRHVICLQTLVRTYLSRKERYTSSVLLVQAAFRRRLLLNILHRSDSHTPQSVFKSVYHIQLFFRMYLERKQRYIHNIILVQTACRKKLLQKIVERKIQEKHIIMIQRAIRQKLDRKIVLKAEQIVANVLNILRCNSDKLNSALTPSEIIPDTTSFFTQLPPSSSDDHQELYLESVKLLQNAFRQRLVLKVAHQQKFLNSVLLLQNAFRRHVVLKTIPKSSDPNLYKSAVFLQSLMRSKLACDEQVKMASAAKLIQGEFRKRLLMKVVKEEPQKASSILFLQSAFKSGLDQNKTADDVSHFEESTIKAAMILQSAFRRKLLMKNVLGAQLLDSKSSFEKSVILIQTIIRNKLAKKQIKPKLKDTNPQKSLIDSFFEMNMAELSSPTKKTEKSGKSFFSMFSSSPEPQGVKKAFNFLESGLRNLISSQKQTSKEDYIILIQSAIRMKFAIKRHRQEQAALLLQAAFRDRLIVKEYLNRVVTVQSAFRSKLADQSPSVILIHPIIHANVEDQIERQQMIVKIQAACRNKLLERKRQELILFFEPDENVDIFEKHVCRIQSAVRRKLRKTESDFERAVIMIQSGFRRNLLPDLSPVEDAWRVSEIELERAALLIQSAFRLRLYRKQISSNDDTYDDSSASSANTVEYLGKDIANDPFIDVFTQHQQDTHDFEEAEVKAVTLLQAAFRQHLYRKEEKIKLVQAVVRRKLLMKLVYLQKDQYHLVRNDLLAARLIKATVLMQAVFRNHLRRKEKGVLILQCAFRKRLIIKARDEVHKKQVEAICGLHPSEISRACLLIQAAFRHNLKVKQDLDAVTMIKPVLLLQSAFRTRLLLKQVQPANSLQYGISRGISPSAYIAAVLLIQNAVRNHLRKREKGILMIQTAFRKILLHRLVQDVYGIFSVEFAIIPAIQLSKGVTLIQSAFRQRLRVKEQSIKLLQAAFRRKVLIKLTNQVSIPNLYPKKSPNTILRSALLLQAAFRRDVRRKENAAALIQNAFRKRILLNIVSEIEQKVDSQYSSTTAKAVSNSANAQSEKVFKILKATLLIQAIFRNNMRKQEKAVLLVQSAFRGKLLMRLTYRARSIEEFETWINTITMVQSAFRRHLRRKERFVILLQTAFRKRLFVNVARNASRGTENMSVERMEVLIRGIIRVQQAIRFHAEKKEQIVRLIQNAFRMKLLTKVASHALSSNQSQTNIVSYSVQDSVPIDHVLLLQRAFRQRLLLKVGRAVYGQNEPLTPQELDNLLRGIVLVQTAFKTNLLRKQKAAELLQFAFRRRMLLNIAQRLDQTNIAIPSNRLAQLLNGIRLVQTVFRQRLRQNEHAALMLQAVFRRRLLYNVASNHLNAPDIGHASIIIKRIILVQTAIRRNTRRKLEACLMIQTAFRTKLLLKLSKNHKQDNIPSVIQATNLIRGILLLQSAIRRQLHADERGVLLMQAAYKKHQFLKLCSSVKAIDSTSKPEMMIRAVLLVQSAFRQKLHAKTSSDHVQYTQHVLILQIAFRRHLMLKLCSKLPNASSLPAGNLVRGIILVQTSIRNHMRSKEKGILMLQAAFRRNLLMKVFTQLPDKQSLRPENLIRGILLFQSAIRHHLQKKEQYVIMLQATFRRHLLMKVFWHLPVGKQMETQPEQLVKGILLFQSAIRYHLRHKENCIKMLQAAFRRRLLLKVFNEIPYERQAFYRPEKLLKGILLFQSAVRDHQMKKEQGVLLLQAAFRKRLLFKVFDKLPYTSQLSSRPENLLRGVMLFQSAVRHHMRQKAKGVLVLQVAFRRHLLMKVFKELPKRNQASLRPENLIRGIILFQSAIRYHIQQREQSVLMLQVAFRRRLLLKAVSTVSTISRQSSSDYLIRGIVLFQSVIRYQQERKRKAAVMVQTAFRMKLLQNVTMMTRQNKFRDCLRIERLIRGVMLFQSSIRYHQQQKLNAALLLQAAFRRKLLFKVVERANVDFELKGESLELQDTKSVPDKEMKISKTIKSVVLVQSIIRRHLERYERRVILIQTAFRTRLLLKIAGQEEGSHPSPVNVVLLVKAITQIQTVFKLKLKRKEASIILVQSAFRRRLLVKVANTIQPNIPISQLLQSVVFVQSIIRFKLLRKLENTLFIQAAIRQTLMKRVAKRFSQSSEKEPENVSAVKLVKAAILIQTAFRRRLERMEGGARLVQNAYRTRLVLKAIDYDMDDLK